MKEPITGNLPPGMFFMSDSDISIKFCRESGQYSFILLRCILMRSKTELKEAIERYLLQKLEKAKCIKGHVTGEYRPDALTLLTVNGTREDGSISIFWNLDQRFRNDIDEWFDNPDPLNFSISINLRENQFHYSTSPYIKPGPVKPPKVELSVVPFGPELAQAVATALNHNNIGYAHRDYCGTGLEKRDGVFYFGPIWDGDIIPKLSFQDEPSFVEWLATQSDASIGGKERYNPQDICRRRLEDWLAGIDH